MKNLKRILAYCLFFCGFFIVTFFHEYAGDVIAHPFLLLLAGALMFYIGWRIIRKTRVDEKKNETPGRTEFIKDLKTTGERITVKLIDCEVKENNYLENKVMDPEGNFLSMEEAEDDYDVVETLGEEFGLDRKIHKIVQVNQTVIVYKHKHGNETETFLSPILPYEKITLLFKLDIKKEATIYVHKINRKMYYFDVEFLSE